MNRRHFNLLAALTAICPFKCKKTPEPEPMEFPDTVSFARVEGLPRFTIKITTVDSRARKHRYELECSTRDPGGLFEFYRNACREAGSNLWQPGCSMKVES